MKFKGNMAPTWTYFWLVLGAKLEPKSLKKSIKNSLIFVFFFGALLEAKLAPKPLQNGGRNRLQDAFQGAWKRKWWKCDFEQHSHVLAIFWRSRRLGNRRKNWKNLTTILSKLEDALFDWILEAKLEAKSHQNWIKIWFEILNAKRSAKWAKMDACPLAMGVGWGGAGGRGGPSGIWIYRSWKWFSTLVPR